MILVNPQYVVDAKQRRKSVLLPFAQWKRVVAALDELDGIRMYDDAKKASPEAIPFEQAFREIKQG